MLEGINSPLCQLYRARIQESLEKPISHSALGTKPQRYRFYKTKARQIDLTVKSIYGSGTSLKKILSFSSNSSVARQTLTDFASGIGPKQASLFIRNIGFADDLAIIDTHVLKFMEYFDLRPGRIPSPSRISTYLDLEVSLKKYAESGGYSIGWLDQAIWIVFRVAKEENFI